MFNFSIGNKNFYNCSYEFDDTGILITCDEGYFFPLQNVITRIICKYDETFVTSDSRTTDANNTQLITSVHYPLTETESYYLFDDTIAITKDISEITANFGKIIDLTPTENRKYTSSIDTTTSATLGLITLTANEGFRYSTDWNTIYEHTTYCVCRIYLNANNDIRPIVLASNSSYSDTSKIVYSVGASYISNSVFYIIRNVYPFSTRGVTYLRLIQPTGTNYYPFINFTTNLTPNTPIYSEFVWELNVADGYEFSNASYNYNRYIGNGSTSVSTQTFTKSNDNKTLQATLDSSYLNYWNVYVNANLVTITEIPVARLSNMVRMYCPTNDELAGLSLINDGRYIMNIYVLPFNLPLIGDVSTDKVAIILGSTTSEQTATQVLSWVMRVDGGAIEIPNIYNNVYDYINTDIEIYLPYMGSFKLDDTVIGRKLNIEYAVNLYSGQATAKVYTGDTVYLTEQKQVGYFLPFYSGFDNSLISEISIPMIEDKTSCYITVTRNIPYTDNGVFGKNVSEYTTLQNKTGYYEIDDIQLDATIPTEMQDEIKSILMGGVFL